MTTFLTVCCVCGSEISRKEINDRGTKTLLSHGYCEHCAQGVKAELAAFKAKLDRGEIALG